MTDAERIAALEAKVAHQHHVLTHLWDAKLLARYNGAEWKEPEVEFLPLGPNGIHERRVELLRRLSDEEWEKPSEIGKDDSIKYDLRFLVEKSLAERDA